MSNTPNRFTRPAAQDKRKGWPYYRPVMECVRTRVCFLAGRRIRNGSDVYVMYLSCGHVRIERACRGVPAHSQKCRDCEREEKP